ncbi:hypothetical protein GCM10010329_82990 [Streptomyces spiroverticillatus]|uniref:Uncharacterized protein n=1 Tax=Streptomyces finlayi TaxID=67296 RepID=A0A918X921_9ACTN|nr:hypothetical protein GCM10010329_82990 [Streptomyces spiroverticillatus]GHD18843.1 hypothetical protein GCM10010334_82050 [Streptomyces finlayi]
MSVHAGPTQLPEAWARAPFVARGQRISCCGSCEQNKGDGNDGREGC